jgi:DNA helicase IV
LVGDEKQAIHAGSKLMEQVSGRLEIKRLSYHYRCGRAICKAADAIGRASGFETLSDNCNYPEKMSPSRVEFIQCVDDADALGKLVTNLSLQLRAYPDELIGVALPLRGDVEKLRNDLGRTTVGANIIDSDDLAEIDSTRRVLLTTWTDSKGLEFRALHLLDPQDVGKVGRERQKKLAFTAVTRAKTLLFIYHTGDMTAWLEQAKADTSAPTPPPDMRKLFPGKK